MTVNVNWACYECGRLAVLIKTAQTEAARKKLLAQKAAHEEQEHPEAGKLARALFGGRRVRIQENNR